ncbi:conserved hypothetical protein [Altererythrobacter sp. B11]|uniref:hypothetical protein n=1 Tax=Altererythrobacter sp. B11 TaxID=2060312 RepID=UPI000DC6E06A|nr:hypothetical protein [Altererythrobacter sp. B11]BBC71864.1 conserved hypothetical protein [Altererythrobacter sp. B11]
MSEALWLFTVVAGPILLIVVMYYGFFRNRQSSQREIREAELGAERLREDIRRDPEYKEE